MTNIDAVIRALGKLGLAATQAPSITLVHEIDARKSLMILPFEDLSPTGDNQWFADGLATELINSLSPIKALRVSDHQATKDYKRYQGSLPNYAKEMSIRYFTQGQVRKFGDQIKISVTLLDIESGDHLWQDSLKGTMNDVFDIQEQVAEKVVEGLKAHLASEEKHKLTERGTENAEAYELYLKANGYFQRQTAEGYRLAVQQLSLAITLDPNYADALQTKAFALAYLYRMYDRDTKLLIEAEDLVHRALAIRPDHWYTYNVLAAVYLYQGRLEEAEEAAKRFVQHDPENPSSHFGLGLFYAQTNQMDLAIEAWEKMLALSPEDRTAYLNLAIASDRTHDAAGATKWSRAALSRFERRLRLVPDDETARVNYATLLRHANEPEKAILALAPLRDKQDLDANSLFNMGCLYARLNDPERALEAIRRSVAAGFAGSDYFLADPDLDSLRGMPEFQELVRGLEAQQEANKGS